MFKDFFHIINPNKDRKAGVRKFLRGLPRLESMWVERTSHPTHVETLVEWAHREGRHGIAVWGGDGTFSRVVNALYEMKLFEKMTVALVPVGTCNDFARKMVIPAWRKW